MSSKSTTIRLSIDQRDRLRDLASERQQTMSDTLDQALEVLRRDMFYREMAESEAVLRSDPDRWAAYESDRDHWLNAQVDQS